MKTNLASALQSVANTNDIRAIKPPVEIPNEWLWLWILLSVLACVALGVVAWYLWKQKRSLPPPVPVIPPHVRAKQRLAEALMFLSDPNRFCTEVSHTVRLYLEERFHLRAPERTTEEFLNELKASSHLTHDQKLSLGEFLQSCDLVKFARFEPTEDSLRALHDSALRLVDETQFDALSVAAAGGTTQTAPPPLPAVAANASETANRK